MLKLYNTLTNKKEEFKSIEKGKVKMYSCGPTVYDYAHIGNFTAYIFADTVRRYLEHLGYEVKFIFNITDVGHLTEDDIGQADSGEDKMLEAALKEKKDPMEIAHFYTDIFFKNAEQLNLKKAHFYPRATAHVPQMIKIIETLIKKEFAYEKNGNVFFDVEKFEGYGKLSNKKLKDLKNGARLEEHPDKKHPYDFALWLKAPKKHILKWESPWSLGYPGWHIECSAMSMEYLGDQLDIHTGAEDNIFPHHENEIAQSECATGKPFSKYWLHLRHLLVDGGKMSKSKGNFYVLKDILDKGYSAMDFRMLILSSHYQSNINFTWDSLKQAKKNNEKIQRFVENLERKSEEDKKDDTDLNIDLNLYKEKIENAMNDNLNSPLALSVVYELINEVNLKISENKLGPNGAKGILFFWEEINKIFGLKFEEIILETPKNILDLVRKRKEARKNKDFKKSDEIRAKIEKLGYVIEDDPEGQKIRRK
jgi:cysteinyl-tRNA synthetase